MPSPPNRTAMTKPVGSFKILFALLGVFAILVVLVAPASAQEPDDPAQASAIAWLDAELAANGGTLPGFVEGTVAWGLMGDFALARTATDRGDEPATRAIAQSLLDNLDAYSTWNDQPDKPGVRISGALAKVYLVAVGAGLDTTDVDGVDLEAEMRSLMVTSGDQAGRFSDRNPYGTDYSNGLGQTLAMMALATTDGGVPVQAVEFLVNQQCPAGGFRLIYTDTPGCNEDTEADPDGTALAIQALMAVERDGHTQSVLADALEWLSARQEDDGSFGGGKFTAAPNANSTGVIAQTLRAAGYEEAAEAAETWVIGQLQIGAPAEGTPAEPDMGAIAYNPTALASALEQGISEPGRGQWRRATSQGVLALEAAPFAPVIGDVPGGEGQPTDQTTTTSTTSTSTTTTTAPTTDDTTTTVASGTTPTTPGSDATGTPGTSATVLGASDVSGSTGDGDTSATAAGSLAYTGSQGAPLAAVGLASVLVGGVFAAMSTSMRRRRQLSRP